MNYHSTRIFPLNISEIYSVVVEHVAGDGLDKRKRSNTTNFQGSKTLLNLALTCKNFKEEALNELWLFQPSLNHLLLCLPPDALSAESTHQGGRARIGTLVRPLGPDDFERVKYYAQKIKILGSTYSPDESRRGTQLAANVLSNVLAQHRGTQPLFPRLMALNCKVHDFFEFSLCEGRLFGEDLKSILLKARVDPFDPLWSLEQLPWIQAFRVISSYLPYLKAFGVYFECDEDRELPCPMPKELQDMIQRLRMVERLTTGDVESSWPLFQQVAAFPNLNHLEISLENKSSLPNVRLSNPLVFPRVRCMHLTVPDPQTCTDLLRLMTLPIITSIAITIDRNPLPAGPWSINPILQALSTQPSRAKIASLYIGRHSYNPDEEGDVEPIDGGSFTYLLPFSGLRHLDIRLNAPIQLDAYTLKRMGESWPSLKSLWLEQRLSPLRPQLRLGDILPLAKSCPSLSYLSLRVDASSDIPKEYRDYKPFQSLEHIDLCTSPIANPEAVADFFQCTMPKVRHVRFGWKYWTGSGFWPDPLDELEGDDAQYHNYWKKVNDLLISRNL